MGQFEPAQHPAFDSIPDSLADRSGLLLQTEVLEAYIAMRDSALRDSIVLTIRSATRNFNYQKRIWNNKWTGKRKVKGVNYCLDTISELNKCLAILQFSSMPGTSRHHWGTDIDLNAFNNAYFEHGEGKKVYDWLQKNAAYFGFYQPYTAYNDLRPTGYQEERWHWSYYPLANTYLKAYAEMIDNSAIRGFYGAAAVPEIEPIKKYVLGVAKSPN